MQENTFLDSTNSYDPYNWIYFLQGVPDQKLRAHLGSFGVTGSLALQPMYTLSGNLYTAQD